MGLQPQSLTCPDARSWGAWDPGAATRQIRRLSPAAGEIHICVCINMYHIDLGSDVMMKNNEKSLMTQAPTREKEKGQFLWANRLPC